MNNEQQNTIEAVEKQLQANRERRDQREEAEARCYELAIALLNSGVSAHAVTDAFGFISGVLYEARQQVRPAMTGTDFNAQKMQSAPQNY